MSSTLDLPELTGSEKMGVSSGWENDASILQNNETIEFVNNSLTNIQTFFSRMVQLDPEENELFGETGRDVNGFRLTTEDEADGVDHDTAISIRSDHVANLSIQSGKASTSDALLNMGTWDSTLGIWGIHGALRVDMSNNNAFEMHSNFGHISFDNVDGTGNRRLTADIFNFKIQSGTQPYAEFQNMDTSNPALFFYNGGDPPTPSNGAIVYAKSGDLFRMKSDASVDEWGAGGSGGSGFDPASTQTITGDWTFNDATFQPASAGRPFTIGSNGLDQEVPGLKAANSTNLNGQDHTYYAAISEAETITGVYAFQPSSGTVPFSTNKTGVVTNLNADKLDSKTIDEIAVLADDETIAGVYAFQPSSGTVPFTTNKTGVVANLNADKLDGYTGDEFGVLAEDETIAGSWTVSSGEEFKIDGTLGATANLTVKPVGDLLIDPDGRDVLPVDHYDINLGSLSKNYLSLHVAELWVQTLVAQETIATIEGRILVGPTTELINDYTAGGLTIDVKHNEMSSGDIVYMQKFDGTNAQIEFFSIDSSSSVITDGFRYDVTGNLDGTGANNWLAGDAVFNTQQTGEGFIDLYSIAGVNSGRGGTPTTYGPTIVGNVRNSSTYNDWTEHWAIGNLNGLYGYSGNTMAVGLGKKTDEHLTIDSTDGIRFFDADGTTVRGQWLGSTLTLGATGQEHIVITDSAISLKNNTVVRSSLAADVLTLGGAGNEHITVDPTNGMRFLDVDGTVRGQLTGSTLTLGKAADDHIQITDSGIEFLDSSTVLGSMTATTVTLGKTGDEHIAISSSGIEFLDGTTSLGSLTATELILGQTTGSLNNVQVSTTGISMREGTTTFATLSNATNDPTLRLEEGTTNKHWEFRKVNNSDNFLVSPETDSIFAFKDAGETVNTFTVDTTPTTGTGTASTNNIVTTQSMGMVVGNPTTFTMGGTDREYLPNAVVNMFSFSLANGEVFQADLTVVGWTAESSPASPSYVVGKYSIFVYKNSGGTVYPATIKVQALSGVGEDIRGLDLSTLYANTITISNAGNVWTVKAQYDFYGEFDSVRLVYELRAIGDFTKLSNLFE